MLMFICLLLATAVFVVFAFLILTANHDIGSFLVAAIIDGETEKMEQVQAELDVLVARVRATGAGQPGKAPIDKATQNKAKALKKKIDASQQLIDGYKKNGAGLLDLPALAGYRVVQIRKMDSTNGFVNTLNNLCLQFKERKEAMNYTYYIVSALIGNIMLGVCLLFLGSGMGLAMGMGTKSLVIGVVGAAIFAILGYLPYDAVNAKIKRRAEDIEHDFPRVVSKLALLTVSGLEVAQAWNLVAESDSTTLYLEMQRVTVDMQHNINAVEAYSRFIRRCNNPYTTKLATAIMQNYSKGNSEIVRLLRDLNKESWSEYKHSAKRRGEQVSSKLMIPTLLMFAGILILVIVPVVGGFGTFG